MQKHNLKRLHKNKKSVQIGRAGGRGKTSGRGTKGQNARAGHKKRPELRDFIKRIPKLRGRGKNSNTSIQEKPVVISLSLISNKFLTGDTINPKSLQEKGLITTKKGNLPRVKILGGETEKKLVISGIGVSASVKSAIEKAGGSIA
jgi:large subunit ribosomal protein L15